MRKGKRIEVTSPTADDILNNREEWSRRAMRDFAEVVARLERRRIEEHLLEEERTARRARRRALIARLLGRSSAPPQGS